MQSNMERKLGRKEEIVTLWAALSWRSTATCHWALFFRPDWSVAIYAIRTE